VPRQQQPALDRVPAEPRERHVEHLGHGQLGRHGGELGGEVVGAGLAERPLPERVEVGGLGPLGTVLAQLRQGHVDEHGWLLPEGKVLATVRGKPLGARALAAALVP
jgi:hypothetical protein